MDKIKYIKNINFDDVDEIYFCKPIYNFMSKKDIERYL